MYKIIGGDGKEYGPITAELLRQWVSEGRASGQSLVQAEGAANWQPLGSLPGFADLLHGPASIPEVLEGAAEARQAALRLATPAGWALQIIGILGILMSLGLIVLTAVKGVQSNPLMEKLMSQHQMTPAMRSGQMIGYFGALAMGVVWAGFICYAGLKLRRLESWGLVLTGAILAVIPFCGSQFPLCILSLPVGIWAIVVVCNRNVKAAFPR